VKTGNPFFQASLSYAQIIIPAGYAHRGILNKDTTISAKKLSLFMSFGKVIF
jgi:hypothetical protein